MKWFTLSFEGSHIGINNLELPMNVLVDPILGEENEVVDLDVLKIELGDTIIVESEGNVFTDDFKEKIKNYILDYEYNI